MRLFRIYLLFVHFLGIAALCSLIAQGQESSSGGQSGQADQAFRTLTHARIFNLGGYGFALGMSREERAFRLLINSRSSGETFQRLLREANPEGQLFALYGLYLEDSEAFKSETERLKHEDGPPERWDEMIFIEKHKIRTAVGCILFREDRNVLVGQMANGEFDQAFKAMSARAFHPTQKYSFNSTLKY